MSFFFFHFFFFFFFFLRSSLNSICQKTAWLCFPVSFYLYLRLKPRLSDCLKVMHLGIMESVIIPAISVKSLVGVCFFESYNYQIPYLRNLKLSTRTDVLSIFELFSSVIHIVFPGLLRDYRIYSR